MNNLVGRGNKDTHLLHNVLRYSDKKETIILRAHGPIST